MNNIVKILQNNSLSINKEELFSIKETLLSMRNIDIELIRKYEEILKSKRVGKNMKSELIAIITKLIEFINEENNYIETTKANNIEIQVTDSIELSSLEEIEKELDLGVAKYNKYSEKNPMLYVNYDEKHKSYRYEVSKKDRKRFNNLSSAINAATKKIKLGKLSDKVSEIPHIKIINNIRYQNFDILVYDGFLFDINHVINVLKDNHDEEFKESSYVDYKYNYSKKHITHYGLKENIYGGYIIKEFINEDKLYQIILSSESEFSRKFKMDISKILVTMREHNLLAINDDSIDLNIVDETNQSIIIHHDVKNHLDGLILSEKFSYANTEHFQLVSEFIKHASNISIVPYMNTHVMYMFIFHIFNDDNLIICKVGYTHNIIARYRSLINEYKCNIYLLSLKIVESMDTEQNFHNMLKLKYNDMIYPIMIRSTNKEEVYYFNEKILKDFNNIPDYSVGNISVNNIVDDVIENSLKNQYIYFIRNMSNFNIFNSLQIINSVDHQTEIMKDYMGMNRDILSMEYEYKKYVIEYEYKTLQINSSKEIELSKNKLEMKKIELEMKKLDINR